MTFETTGRMRVQSDKSCFLYDPKDGTICYSHRIVTLVGADETPEKDVERRATELAKEINVDVRTLKALHVDASDLDLGRAYRVDPRKRVLVGSELKVSDLK